MSRLSLNSFWHFSSRSPRWLFSGTTRRVTRGGTSLVTFMKYLIKCIFVLKKNACAPTHHCSDIFFSFLSFAFSFLPYPLFLLPVREIGRKLLHDWSHVLFAWEREREVTRYSSHSLSHKAVAVFKNFFLFLSNFIAFCSVVLLLLFKYSAAFGKITCCASVRLAFLNCRAPFSLLKKWRWL